MRCLRSRLSLVLAFCALAVASGAADEPEFSKTVVISGELKVGIARGDLVFLFAKPLPGEGINAFARRFSDDPATKARILSLNRKSSVLRQSVFLRVPYELLSGNYRKIAMQALFSADSGSPRGWTHTVAALAGEPESLWRVAEWFTGDGANYDRIRRASGAASLQTEKGQKLKIPIDLLLPVFRAEALAREATGNPPLAFLRDTAGPYAAYRLQKGEALYSAVVVRFTGLVYADEVNSEAAKIAARSGVTNVHSIPVGYEIKIPVEDLLPDYRPADDPKRVEYERSRLEASQFENHLRAAGLKGVTVILDPGHGGRDTGALVSGVAEARYVYDITMRTAELLRTRTRARVVVTVEDRSIGGATDRDRLTASSGGRVMTSPPYPIDDAVAGVHLRWYLSNSLLRSVVSRGGDASHVVFLSFHADSLHPSVRGAMVYIPGEQFLKASFGKSGAIYEARREYRQAPRVSFSRRERLEAEGVSRGLAEKIVEAFRQDGLPVHTFQPIRESVIRSGRQWVPAVIRYNEVPARALV
ncbi:MAG: N-acetylmuramoyl-L-alanine amidase family protein, partial [Thermoanaerobaculia bacterium]